MKEHRRSLPTTENRIKVIAEGDFLVVWNLKEHRRSLPTTENRRKVIAKRFSCAKLKEQVSEAFAFKRSLKNS